MVVHIGDCDICEAIEVRITYGWTHLTPNKHCQKCDEARKKSAAKSKGKSGFMVAPETDQHKEAKAAKVELKFFLLETKGHICEECGTTNRPLDLSHLISVGARKDLEEGPENVVLHCRECHMKWENGTLEWKRASTTFSKHHTYIQRHSTRL